MGGSGGGQSGAVSYPGYIMAIQSNWLVGSQYYEDLGNIQGLPTMNDTMDDALGNSPFLGATAYDGATRISNMETEVGAFQTIVDALDPQTDWDSILTKAVTSIEEHWNAYTVNAPADIGGAWIDPSHTSYTNIKGNWLDPSPAAYTNIKGNWLDPTPAAAAEISADVDAFEAIVDDRVENTVLARFQRGMQDINGVMTSAFTIGQAIIEGMADRDVAKYQGELRTKAYLLKDQLVATGKLEESKALAVAYDLNDQLLAQGKLGESNRLADAYIESDKMDASSERGESDALAQAHMQDDRLNADNVKGSNLAFLHSVEQMVKLFLTEVGAQQTLSTMIIDVDRMALEAERAEALEQLEIDEADAKWDLSVFQYGANLLAASGGGSFVPPPKTGPTKAQSTIGGAASGAAMGAQVGTAVGQPHWGAGIGAVVGAYMGYSQN